MSDNSDAFELETRLFTPTPYAFSHSDILQIGKDIHSSATSDEGWITPPPPTFHHDALTLLPGGSWWLFNGSRSAPTKGSVGGNEVEMKEWGEPVEEDERWNVEELEEWKEFPTRDSSGDGDSKMQDLSPDVADTKNRHANASTSSSSPGSPTSPLPSTSKRKRTSLKLPFYNLIPLPHIHLSPMPTTPIPVDHIPEYPYREYIPGSEEVDWTSPWTRVSWIIPVQGVVKPLDTEENFGLAAGNVVLEPDPPPDKKPPLPLTENTITWTPRTLSAFWSELLLPIHKNQVMGPLDLSYVLPTRDSQTKLSYIKVGCNVVLAARLRTVLASWAAPEDENEDKKGEKGKEKDNVLGKYTRRYFKTNKILLVDCTGRGIAVA